MRAAALAFMLLLAPPWTVDAQSIAAEARAAFQRGVSALANSRIDVAREAFARAAALAPEWGLAFLEWGAVEASIDPKSALALECLHQAAELAPGNPRVHYQLGLLYEQQEKYADAVRELKAAIALRPTMVDARFHLARLLILTGARDEAATALEAVIAADAGHTGALAALAELYEGAGKIDAAETALLSIAKIQPQIAFNHVRLGQFYERQGDQRKAQAAFAKAEALDPRPKRNMRKLR
ncbi:MAG: tetratricopeptide repeat protein [Deltaproteobacteria bacterium]|nr:tetratricopeptide repeat protein [Deltaproteobacteria bacterium]